jgi:hypothetical protein
MKEPVMNKAANNQRSNSLNPNNPAYRAAMNNHANQLNPNSQAHRAAMNNHSNQLNPNNPAYQGPEGSGEKSGVATAPDKR